MYTNITTGEISGETLREWRLKARYTLFQAAKIANVRSRKTIMNWESNRSNPTHNQAIALALHYGAMEELIELVSIKEI